MLKDNLKKIREKKGFSKTQLSDISSVDRRTIMLIEEGRTLNPGINTLNRLAKALEINVADLLK